MDDRSLEYAEIKSVKFSSFSTEDILKLSVKEITTSSSFDPLGHPLPGGLYDPVFGPISDRSGPCDTCGKHYHQCTGHFGHIKLPVPVFHQMYLRELTDILKATCYSCYKIIVPKIVKHAFVIQMKLLYAGLLTEAQELAETVDVLLEDNSNDKSEDTLTLFSQFAETAAKHDSQIFITRNTESLYVQFIENLMKRVKDTKKCSYCSAGKNEIECKYGKITNKSDGKRIMMPDEIRDILRLLWINDKDFLLYYMPLVNDPTKEFPTDLFLFEVILVPPPIVRPVKFIDGKLIEDQQTRIYEKILENARILKSVILVIKENGDVSKLPEEIIPFYERTWGETAIEKMNNIWMELQISVNCIISNADIPGIKQILEKKHGIIRQNMMGKRVNYSARSVITPDPCLNTDEIGIPEALAKVLTYPVPVTSYNASMLKQMILNGPNVHPGAVEFESEDGTRRRIPLDRKARESIAKRLLLEESTNRNRIKGVKTVHRHIINGDVVYVNRQPTLHKPGIMAHKARIQKGDKTLRLHYANCKAYNADFDGDEMNIHVPQSELARSEALNIANVCKQYTVPKDGTPLSGLIQDHVISAVRLSIQGRFFNRKDYHNLVYTGLVYKTRPIHFLPPAILKPKCLWSGKQVISTVIMNTIPSDECFVNLVSKAKIGAKEWIQKTPRKWLAGGTPFSNPSTMSEAEVVIRNGELLCGVIDKQQIGSTPYCLIHCIFELYGGKVQSDLLSAFSRLFTSYQQIDGFTLGVRDILIKNTANRERKQHIEKLRKIGNEVISKTLGLDRKVSENELKTEMEEAYTSDPKFRSQVDGQYKESLDKYTDDINKACIPNGLLCTFPENNLQLMVTSGAKGSIVNCMQISCLLGQIALEGKRPPLTVSGRSLPSFPPYDTSPRAGGFIDGRFMTGIKPQEFFFHCMAGREGLIDTAVKTSRSGYLQRCLIKHLEGLSIRYDRTVRDSDDSVVQFYYGEDGMDISKVKFLDKKYIHFLNENSGVILKKDVKDRLENMADGKIKESVAKHLAVIEQWRNKYGSLTKQSRRSMFTDFSSKVRAAVKKTVKNPKKLTEKTGRSKLDETIIKYWRNMSASDKKKFSLEGTRCPDPVTSIYQPDSCLGVLNERLQSLLSEYCKNKNNIDSNTVKDMFNIMATTMLSEPGEPVGTIAAESIGEPSTQMTLNTFHFAGRNEMNVTLGIPRLKEIFNCSRTKTPSIKIPFKSDLNTKKTDQITKKFCRVTIADLLEKIDVKSKLKYCPHRQQSYTLKFFFLPQEIREDNFGIKSKFLLKVMKRYFPKIIELIKKEANAKSSAVTVQEKKKRKTQNAEENGNVPDIDEDDSDDEIEDAEEDAKIQHKMADKDFEEPEKNEEPPDEFAEEMQNNGDEAENKEEPSNEPAKEMQESEDEAENKDYTYKYDEKELRWCSMRFVLPFSFKQIDVSNVLETFARKKVIKDEIPEIKRAISYKNNDDGTMMLQTDGVNMSIFFLKYSRYFDMNKLYCNDICEIANTYGIEAARKAIVKEIREVFKLYGIDVDFRHLLLVADYMTFDGTLRPCTRTGMKNNTSSLQQMTFESTMQFLKSATLNAKQDTLSSPSACLMVGKPILMGTGAFDLMQANITLN